MDLDGAWTCPLVPLKQHLKLREVTSVPVWLETLQIPSKSVFEAGDRQLHHMLD